MDDAAVMRSAQGVSYLRPVAQHGLDAQPGIADKNTQRLALDQLHHNVELTTGLTNLVNGADVGMVQSRRGTCLVQQVLTRRLIQPGAARNHLQGYVAMEDFITGPVNYSHSSLADFG